MNIVNPFNITFGKEPTNKINREIELDEIVNTFSNENPSSEVYILTGPRGSGKTVAMTSLSDYYASKKDFIVVDLNPEMELLEQLASKLYDRGKVKKLFVKTEFNFSFHGVSLSINGDFPLVNVSTLLDKIFTYLKSKKYKVLITIDEVVSNQYMKIFAHEFQRFMRQNYDVLLLMTGLYENISNLENEKSLTFLYRAPKIQLNSLSIKKITTSYQNVFGIDYNDALNLAKMTKGYAFAYQLLGYILFKSNKTKVDQDVLDEFDDLLENRVYAKIWESLSKKEKEIMHAVSIGKDTNQEIMSEVGIKSNALAVYKKKLEMKGLISTKERGLIISLLPRFLNFIKFYEELE